MKKSAFAAAVVACFAGSAIAGTVGPDVIVGTLPQVQRFGQVSGVTGYSIATTSCNIGDTVLEWNPNTNIHPVISQSISRVAPAGDNGTKIEMLGISWLKHGFCALQGTVCGSCMSAGGGCPTRLGVGCSDPYSSSLNGQQSNLGLPADVDAHRGFYQMPFTGRGQTSSVRTYKRIPVATADLDPSLNPGATFFGAGQYVQSQDSSFGNQDNNASYRQITVGSINSNGPILSLTGSTFREMPVIFGWKRMDSSVTILPISIPEAVTAGDNDGLV